MLSIRMHYDEFGALTIEDEEDSLDLLGSEIKVAEELILRGMKVFSESMEVR